MKETILKLDLEGAVLLQNPLYNKQGAFTQKERKFFGLEGMLPPRVVHLQEQLQAAYLLRIKLQSLPL